MERRRQAVFYCGADSLSVVDVSSPGDPGVPQNVFSWPWFNLWAIDSKRQWFLRPMATGAEPINVVLNWTAGLRKK
jgi:hypothetical protein